MTVQSVPFAPVHDRHVPVHWHVAAVHRVQSVVQQVVVHQAVDAVRFVQSAVHQTVVHLVGVDPRNPVFSWSMISVHFVVELYTAVAAASADVVVGSESLATAVVAGRLASVAVDAVVAAVAVAYHPAKNVIDIKISWLIKYAHI